MTTTTANTEKWYDKTWLVVILCLFIFPIGLYALWKSSKIAKGWKIAWTVIIGVLAIASLSGNKSSSTASNTSNSSNTSSASQDNSSNTPTYKKIGDQIDVGNFSYVVNNIRFTKTVGSDYSQKTADGIYLIIDVTFRNNDKEEHTLDNSLFKLTDENGTEFESSSDGETALEMEGKETLFLKECNPNITKSGLLIFEVPDKKVYDLHLSGGMWDGETTIVKLTGN
jgi:hypothetical protein